MKRWGTMVTMAAAGLGLLAPVVSRADVPAYQFTAPVCAKDQYEGRNIFQVGDLNNRGQFTFNMGAPEHIHVWDGSQVLVLSSADISLPEDGPFSDGNVWSPHGINDAGQVAWIGDMLDTGDHIVLTYDLNTKQYTVIARPGQPAPGGGEFVNAGVRIGPSHRQSADINNKGQVVWNQPVPGEDGEPRNGIFMYDPATKEITALMRPGSVTTDGKTLEHAWTPGINDLSQVVFTANEEGIEQYGIYLWEQGNITPIAVPGMEFNGEPIDQASYPRIADNGDIALVAQFGEGHPVLSEGTTDDTAVLYYTTADKKVQVLVKPEDPLPDGMTFRGVEMNRRAVAVNSRGQVLIMAVRTEDDRGALYLWEAGQLNLITRFGDTIPGVGEVTGMGKTTPDAAGGTWDGYHVAINDRSDIAFTAQIDGVGCFILGTAPATDTTPPPAAGN